MPRYLFKNPETGEIKEIFQKMNDVHTYSENGKEWKRIFTLPNATMDLKVDPFSKKQFIEKTKNVKTYGEAWKISEEMSERRSEKLKKPDPIKIKAEKKFYKPQNNKA